MEKLLTVIESKDGHIPENLEKVIQSIEAKVGNVSTNQLLYAVFYTLMLESGFILNSSTDGTENDNNANGDNDKSVNSNRTESDEKCTMTFNLKRLSSQTDILTPYLTSSSGVYKVPFQLIGIPDCKFHLIMIPAGDLVVTNLLVVKDEFTECFSIALRTQSFVPRPDASTVAQKFFDLRTLSIVFKDNIAHKGRSLVLNMEGLTNNSLEGLLEEVKHKIMMKLPIEDVLNFSLTCSRIHSETFQKTVWKSLLRRDFNFVSDEKELSREELVCKYKELKESNRRRKRVKLIANPQLLKQWGMRDYRLVKDSFGGGRPGCHNFRRPVHRHKEK